jgi:hypothetical protein
MFHSSYQLTIIVPIFAPAVKTSRVSNAAAPVRETNLSRGALKTESGSPRRRITALHDKKI